MGVLGGVARRLEDGLRARIAAADPIDPGVPLPADPWADDILPRLPFERRGSKLYLPGAEARLEGREAEAPALGASSRRPASARRRSPTPSSPASWRRAGGSSVSATATRSEPAAFEVAKDVLLAECRAAGEITLARFRDLVGTDAATRSSCSSGSITTGSRAATATPGTATSGYEQTVCVIGPSGPSLNQARPPALARTQ